MAQTTTQQSTQQQETVQRWRHYAALITAAVEEGDAESLNLVSECPESVLDTAVSWGLSLREEADGLRMKPSEFAALLRQCYEQRLQPKRWVLSKVERIERGAAVEIWRADYYAEGSTHRSGWFEFDARGDSDTDADSPPLGLILRDVRAALKRAETAGQAVSR